MTAVLRRARDGEARMILIAISVSVVVHLILIGSVAGILVLRPDSLESEKTPTEEEPLQITLMDPPKQSLSYIETTPSQAAAPPENPVFESDKDTQAAAPLPPSGDAPVPTQEGVQAPGLEFENQEHTAGPQPAAAAVAAQPPPSSPPAPIQPQSTPAPPVPAATPKPAELALLEQPKPTPRSAPSQPPAKPVQDQAPSSTPAPQTQEAPPSKPATPGTPGYQPQTRITRIRGNISNRGRSSVAASATPMGRYKKMLSDAIGSRWYYYVNSQIDLLNPGTLELRFIVRKDGKVEKVQVVRNSSNESFAACSVRAIMEAEIPPIPTEIVPMLEGERIEIEYSFTILSH